MRHRGMRRAPLRRQAPLSPHRWGESRDFAGAWRGLRNVGDPVTRLRETSANHFRLAGFRNICIFSYGKIAFMGKNALLLVLMAINFRDWGVLAFGKKEVMRK